MTSSVQMPKLSYKERGGARMFYVPDTQWLIVLPINHILGRVPLMKAYLCGSSMPTIPQEFSHHKQAYFKYGHADRNGREGSGSPMFMLNVHMWQFRRPQARTIPVQQRHANRNWGKRLPIRNALNVCLKPGRKPRDDGR